MLCKHEDLSSVQDASIKLSVGPHSSVIPEMRGLETGGSPRLARPPSGKCKHQGQEETRSQRDEVESDIGGSPTPASVHGGAYIPTQVYTHIIHTYT